MLFDIFGGNNDLDDINALPRRLQEPYTNPYKLLGVDRETSSVAMLRDAFRRQVIAMIPHFSGFNVPRFGADQLNLAYHIARGTLTGPATKIAREFDQLPQLDFDADYILPTLRPMLSDFPCRSEYRGFRMMSITCCGSHLEYPAYEWKSMHTTVYGWVPTLKFDFDVHYMLRRHTVSIEYAAFQKLNEELERELLSVPELPPYTGTRQDIGDALARYAMRVHSQLAGQGLFSPRLLRFLGVDFERVQTEEEGAIIAILDTGKKPPATVWHIIDEDWLARWRLYAMGRGPRRYFPPGRIDNRQLLQDYNRGKAEKELRRVEHYRCVNFNVWRFYELVHGGGPVITRIDEDIYGRPGLSYLQACIIIQTWMRIWIAKMHRRFLLMKRLSATPLGKAMIIETALEKVHNMAIKYINDNNKARKVAKLKDACIFTQNTWRLKKNYKPEKQLIAIKETHQIFRAVKDLEKDIAKSAADGQVIENEQPIVRIGNTNVYDRTIYNTTQGLPFRLERIPGTEMAKIVDPDEPDEFLPGSLLLSIQDYPTNVLTFDEVKTKLAAAVCPIKLTLEQELERKLVPTINDLVSLSTISDHMAKQAHGGINPLVFNAFKVMAKYGMYWIKHTSGQVKLGAKNFSWDNSCHLTKVRITDRQFFYTHRYDPTKEEEAQWSSFYLYKLKFVLRNGKQCAGSGGNEATVEEIDDIGNIDENDKREKVRTKNPSDTIKHKHRKLLRQEYCFEIVTDDRGLVFEIPTYLRLAKLLHEEREMRKQQAEKELQVMEQKSKQAQRLAQYEKGGKMKTQKEGGTSVGGETPSGGNLPNAADETEDSDDSSRQRQDGNGADGGVVDLLPNKWWVNDSFCAEKITSQEFGPERFFCSSVGLPIAQLAAHEVLPLYDPTIISNKKMTGLDEDALGEAEEDEIDAFSSLPPQQRLQKILESPLPSVAEDDSVDDEHRKRCDLIFDCLSHLVLEVRKSQIFVDKKGLPTRRTKPKRSLMRYPVM